MRVGTKWLLSLVFLVLSQANICSTSHGQVASVATSDARALSERFRQAAKGVSPSLVMIQAKCGCAECVRQNVSVAHLSTQEVPLGSSNEKGGLATKRDIRGTGLIVDKRGYVLTCSHVVEHAEAVFVTLANGRRLEAKEVRVDPYSDLAVLYLPDAVDLPVAKFANSESLQVGDWVVSVGHPYGLLNSISAGIVSALDREVSAVPRAGLIQSDAASNPGTSGGALMNIDGDIIGVCEGGYGESAGFEGISFAVPSNVAREVAEQLIQFGAVRRGYLGCHSEQVTLEIAACLGMRSVTGVIITAVSPKSPANGKIQIGDVILSFDGQQIATTSVWTRSIEKADLSKSHELLIQRKGKSLVVRVTLEQLLTEAPRLLGTRAENGSRPNSFVDIESGMTLEPSTPRALERLGYGAQTNGLLISRVEPGKKASKAGIFEDTLVISVDGRPIGSTRDYQSAINEIQKGSSFLVLVGSPEGNRHVVLTR